MIKSRRCGRTLEIIQIMEKVIASKGAPVPEVLRGLAVGQTAEFPIESENAVRVARNRLRTSELARQGWDCTPPKRDPETFVVRVTRLK